jgi:hypothetical protein
MINPSNGIIFLQGSWLELEFEAAKFQMQGAYINTPSQHTVKIFCISYIVWRRRTQSWHGILISILQLDHWKACCLVPILRLLQRIPEPIHLFLKAGYHSDHKLNQHWFGPLAVSIGPSSHAAWPAPHLNLPPLIHRVPSFATMHPRCHLAAPPDSAASPLVLRYQLTHRTCSSSQPEYAADQRPLRKVS